MRPKNIERRGRRYNSPHKQMPQPAQHSGASGDDVSKLLRAWSHGDQGALEKLTPIVYHELHHLAGRYMKRERAGHSLQTTALVHEVYTRLVDYKRMHWQDRAHFFAVSANMMRRILVDRARAKGMAKRGGAALRPNLDEVPELAAASKDREIVAIDDALDALAQIDPRKAKVIELRFFGGLSVEEAAEVLNISPQSVMRDWKMARAWIMAELAH